MKQKHINIPIFIPHDGCPHDCIFCNQRRISGQSRSPDSSEVIKTINDHLATAKSGDLCEIAFFGGSFTGLPPDLQEKYLRLAYGYIEKGIVSGIRLSTRPDYINKDILEFLKQYSVKVIELGIQSLDEDVLLKSGRLYTPEEAIQACYLVKDSGFSLGTQTMIGLPGDTFEKSLSTAKSIISIKPDMIRIYPTLVIRDTGLFDLYNEGAYSPLSLEDAVLWCSQLIPLYEAAGITILRIGLHDTGGLQRNSDAVAGPVHPAFGELVYSKIWLEMIIKELETYGLDVKERNKKDLDSKELITKELDSKASNTNEMNSKDPDTNELYKKNLDTKELDTRELNTYEKTKGKKLLIHIHPSEVSRVIGQNRSSINFLKERYNLSQVKVLPNMENKKTFLIEFQDEQ